MLKNSSIEENHAMFERDEQDFVDIYAIKKSKKGSKENPLQNSPSSFFRTICLQLDILRTADKFKLIRELNEEHFLQLIEIYVCACDSLTSNTVVNSIIKEKSKSIALHNNEQISWILKQEACHLSEHHLNQSQTTPFR